MDLEFIKEYKRLLLDYKNELFDKMIALRETAEAECRAMSEEEIAKFDKLDVDIKDVIKAVANLNVYIYHQ